MPPSRDSSRSAANRPPELVRLWLIELPRDRVTSGRSVCVGVSSGCSGLVGEGAGGGRVVGGGAGGGSVDDARGLERVMDARDPGPFETGDTEDGDAAAA